MNEYLEDGPGSAVTRRQWVSRLLWWALALAAVILTYRQLAAVNYDTAQDSWFPVSSALAYLHSHPHGDVYQALLFERHVKFQYPPSGLLMFEGLRAIGVEGARQYNALNAMAMVASCVLVAFLVNRLFGHLSWRGVALPLEPLAYIAALKFYPGHLALVTGQVQVLLNLMFLAALLALWFDRRVLAGVLIALSAIIKPQFLVFGLLMLRRRDWRSFWGFSAVSAVALLVSVLLYGPQVQWTYASKVLPFLSLHGECFHLNQSVNGVLSRSLEGACVDADPEAARNSPVISSWFPPYDSTVYHVSQLATLVLLLVPFLFAPKAGDRKSDLLHFCLAAAFFTMASPIAWAHHFGVVLPAYVLLGKALLDRLPRRDAWAWLVVLGISWLLVAVEWVPFYAPTDPRHNLRQSHVFIGLCLLMGALVWTMRRLSTERLPEPTSS